MEKKKRVTKKQKELLNFINNFINMHGYSPSYREIMRALDYRSVSTVAIHIDGLVACGLLSKEKNSSRSLEVKNDSIIYRGNNQKYLEHMDWLREEIRRREANQFLKEEAEILKKCYVILGGE